MTSHTHLTGVNLPMGVTVAACGDPVRPTEHTWSLAAITCPGCLEAPIYGDMAKYR